MGEVYRARDARLERTVAIKILPEHLSSSAEMRARFEREARAASALNHPHICHLYDIGSQDGIAYLVMEYLDGDSLADRLHKGALPLKQTLQIGVQIAEALATAHRAGILHRDLKPGNVMLTAAGAKLLDFGLAKKSPALAGGVSGLSLSTPTMTIAELSSPAKALTQQGSVVGTIQYMAPEVLQGAEADTRSDIFGLGCVLYEMATGRRAFDGKSQLSVLIGILEKDPDPVSRVQPTSPPALDHVVKTCLEKNPDERFQTAHDVKVQLKWIAEGGSQAELAAPGRRSSRLGWLAAAILLVALAASIAAYVNLAARPGPVVRSSILPPLGMSFITMTPTAGPPVLSPDGTRLAFTARDEKGKVLLYVRALASASVQPLAGTEDASYPFWAPDNRQIGFFVPDKLMKIDANGGPPQTVCEASNGRGGAWSKQGVIVLNSQSLSSLVQVSASGGSPQPATKLDASEISHRWPQFLPDGKHFLFWARGGGPEDNKLYVGSLGSSQTKAIMKSTGMAVYASGYLLFMRDASLVAQPFDLRRLEPTGEPESIVDGVTLNELSGRAVFSASENGTLIYQSGTTAPTWTLQWLGRDGKQAGSITQQGAPYFTPTLSPDGDRLAVSFNGALGTVGIWVFDLRRGTRTRITFENGAQHNPLWAPDGQTVFYGSRTGGINHIYAKAADGSGSVRTILASDDASEYPSSISPDGRYLVYHRRASTDTQASYDLWVLPLFGDGKPFPIVRTSFDDINAAVAPNGKWMAYQNNESGHMEVYITPFPGGGAKWQVSTSGGVSAHWRRDGKELFFLDAASNVMAVDVDTSGSVVRLGVPHALFSAVAAQRASGPFDVTADGKKFLINSGDVKEGNEPMTLVQNWTAELKK
jgi:Tol biopolymer transport system component